MSLYDRIVNFIVGRIEWSSLKYFFTGRYYNLSGEDIRKAVTLMQSGRYIGLLRRNTHGTTYLISFAHWIATMLRPSIGRSSHLGYWSHAFMHVEDETNPLELEIMEAVGSGVKSSDFWDVLNCDAICLLKPKNFTEDQMENVIKYARSLIGTPYDTAFNLSNTEKVSCVEFTYAGLLHEDLYGLPMLSTWVKNVKNLTPDMMYESGDFEIVMEVRK